MPAFLFFDCLRNREFPTTITIRDADHLDYLPEPDIFHDVAGHVPMHTDRVFADTLVRLGECAHTAAEMMAETRGDAIKLERLRATWWGTNKTRLGLRCAETYGPRYFASALLETQAGRA